MPKSGIPPSGYDIHVNKYHVFYGMRLYGGGRAEHVIA